MSKTWAGVVMLSGLALVVITGRVVGSMQETGGSPADDWYYDLLSYGGLAIGLVGVGMFFYGAMVFARR